MVDNQHKKIVGYRDLTEEEIETMNKIKVHGELVKELMEEVKAIPGVDQRWLAIANTNLQQGFMAATRSVAKPTSY